MSKYRLTCPRCGSTEVNLCKNGVRMTMQEVATGHFVRCAVCRLCGPTAYDEQSAVYWWSQMSKLVQENA